MCSSRPSQKRNFCFNVTGSEDLPMAQMAPLKYSEQSQVKPTSFKSLHVALFWQGSIEQVTAARSTDAVSVDFNERAREVRFKHRTSITTPARTTAYTHASIQTGTQKLYSIKLT